MSDETPRRRMVRPPSGGAARGPDPVRLKTGKGRTASQRAWLERQLADPYAAEARAHGYRSRAAYKLREIDDRCGLIRRGARIVDLGCAPGGWLQVAQERGAGRIVGVDLLPTPPLAGVQLIEADFTDNGVAARLLTALGGAPDLILSDMAPNTVGHRRTDHLRIVTLIEAAADFAGDHLAAGGAFLVKAFQGGETASILAVLKPKFATVRNLKPKASRAESSELYILAQGFKGRDA